MPSAAREACRADTPTSRGESEPKSQEFPALSPEGETASAAGDACRADTPTSHGGK